VEYPSASALVSSDFQAAEVIKGMRGFVLDGHVLKVDFSGRQR
jgi:hypothetical protein